MQKNKLLIRRLGKRDADALAVFLAHLGRGTKRAWNTFGNFPAKKAAGIARSQAFAKDKEMAGYVAIEGNTIQGYGFLRFFPEKPQKRGTCSLGIVVDERQRGKGIGRAMMGFMIKDARKRGMRKIWLGTYSTNSAALKLYRELGFQIEGIFMSDEWFEGTPYHTVSMALFLDGSGGWNRKERKRLTAVLEGEKVLAPVC